MPPVKQRATSFAAATAVTASLIRPEEHPRVVPIGDVAFNPRNPRHDLEEDLDDIGVTLQEHGQVTALTVVSRDAYLGKFPEHEEDIGPARYVAVDGNRRLAAHRKEGLATVRIDVNDALADAGITESALIAGLTSKKLNPVEEAEAVRDLMRKYGSTHEVGRRIGKTHVWVLQRINIDKLIPELKQALLRGTITVQVARETGKLRPDQQAAAAKAAMDAAAAAKAAGPRKNRRNLGGGPVPGNGVTGDAGQDPAAQAGHGSAAPGRPGQQDSGAPGPDGCQPDNGQKQDRTRAAAIQAPAAGGAGPGNGVTGPQPSGPARPGPGRETPADVTAAPAPAPPPAGNAVTGRRPAGGGLDGWTDLGDLAARLRSVLDPPDRARLAELLAAG